ncbi:MAG TPA: hypothetical protein VEH30_09170 [Terriglobales bacterium]|nr:hypothetical protein [Terriglobales bacterium]
MRKLVVIVCSLVLCVSVSAADDKISSQWKCDGKPSDEHSMAVGDHEGHAYVINQGKCASEKGAMGDAKEQEGMWTQFLDSTGNKVKNHGVFVVTLAGGDKVFYNYHGTQTVKDGKVESGSNAWILTGGTGKFEGVKGEGACKGKGNPDGSSTWNCEGTYSMGK